MQEKQDNQIDTYWQANIRLVLSLLSIWFLVSFGCGILFVDFLDQFQFFGFKLGFWFLLGAVFYLLIFSISFSFLVLNLVFGFPNREAFMFLSSLFLSI